MLSPTAGCCTAAAVALLLYVLRRDDVVLAAVVAAMLIYSETARTDSTGELALLLDVLSTAAAHTHGRTSKDIGLQPPIARQKIEIGAGYSGGTHLVPWRERDHPPPTLGNIGLWVGIRPRSEYRISLARLLLCGPTHDNHTPVHAT